MTLSLPLLMIKIFETISIFVIPSFLLLYQYIMFKSGVKFKDDTLPVDLNSLPYLTVLVPTKGEKPEVIQGLLENLSRVKWNEEKLEVIVISDDNEEEFNRLVEKLKVPNKLKARILRRDVKIGYKSGALSYGFNISNGDLILTLDVDARLEKDSLIRAYSHMRSLGCDAVTLNWIGYTTNKHSTLAKGVIISTIIADRSLLNGRDRRGLQIFPVGCGTLFKRDALKLIGGWDPLMIQDDLEIGARLVNAGRRICSSTSQVFVEVPDNLVAFYVQQSRWAMGSIEVLTKRLKEITSKNISLIQKIDIFIFLLQYVPIALTFVAALVLAAISFIPGNFSEIDYLSSPLVLIWLIALGIYGFNFINTARTYNFNLVESLRALGKISSYTVAISPFILIGLFSGLRKTRKYIVTPKGTKVTTRIQYPILAFGIIFLLSSLIYLYHASYITGTWLLYYSMGYLFTVLTFKREL